MPGLRRGVNQLQSCIRKVKALRRLSTLTPWSTRGGRALRRFNTTLWPAVVVPLVNLSPITGCTHCVILTGKLTRGDIHPAH